MLKPLEQWYCDKCGEIIENYQNGYVIWKQDENYKDYDFKIIHKSKCDDKNFRSSASLSDFLGKRGLVNLTSMLSIGTIKINLGQKGGKVRDLDEFIDFFRRVQLPFYEEARQKFNKHEILDMMSDANEIFPYLEEQLKDIIKEEISE